MKEAQPTRNEQQDEKGPRDLPLTNIRLQLNPDGTRWLIFRTHDKSCAALNIAVEFCKDRVVHEVIRKWALERASQPSRSVEEPILPCTGDEDCKHECPISEEGLATLRAELEQVRQERDKAIQELGKVSRELGAAEARESRMREALPKLTYMDLASKRFGKSLRGNKWGGRL